MNAHDQPIPEPQQSARGAPEPPFAPTDGSEPPSELRAETAGEPVPQTESNSVASVPLLPPSVPTALPHGSSSSTVSVFLDLVLWSAIAGALFLSWRFVWADARFACTALAKPEMKPNVENLHFPDTRLNTPVLHLIGGAHKSIEAVNRQDRDTFVVEAGWSFGGIFWLALLFTLPLGAGTFVAIVVRYDVGEAVRHRLAPQRAPPSNATRAIHGLLALSVGVFVQYGLLWLVYTLFRSPIDTIAGGMFDLANSVRLGLLESSLATRSESGATAAVAFLAILAGVFGGLLFLLSFVAYFFTGLACLLASWFLSPEVATAVVLLGFQVALFVVCPLQGALQVFEPQQPVGPVPGAPVVPPVVAPSHEPTVPNSAVTPLPSP